MIPPVYIKICERAHHIAQYKQWEGRIKGLPEEMMSCQKQYQCRKVTNLIAINHTFAPFYPYSYNHYEAERVQPEEKPVGGGGLMLGNEYEECYQAACNSECPIEDCVEPASGASPFEIAD